VVEHDDFDGQFLAVTLTQAHQLGDSDDGEVQKRQCHVPGSSPEAVPRKACSGRPDEIVGTHRRSLDADCGGQPRLLSSRSCNWFRRLQEPDALMLPAARRCSPG